MKVVESDTQAIVECLEVVFLDEYHVVQVESLNKVLHNIVSHNIDVNHSGNGDLDSTLIAKV